MRRLFLLCSVLLAAACGGPESSSSSDSPDAASIAPDAATFCIANCTDRRCGSDGCGGSCGSCSGATKCEASSGTCVACTPSCSGKECGSDGCSGSCGLCSGSKMCAADGHCVACTPTSCTAERKNCGSIPDGCGGTLSCGNCTVAGESCGGAGVQNVCGAGTCVPTSCSKAGRNCGPLADGCGTVLDCGTCMRSGETCGGGGAAGVCGVQSCTPTSCMAQGKNCGSIPDGCGKTLACGSCGANESCGGVTPNVCAKGCTPSCLQGYSCDAAGVCGGGDATMLNLDVKTIAVAGTVTLNGAAPTRNSCSGPRAEVVFTETTWGYVFTFPIPCTSTSFNWSGSVYPGTYKVKVAGYSGASNLPSTYYFTHDALQVTAPVTNLALDVKTLPVSGTVTLNGAAPSRSSCSGPRAEVVFTETTNGYVFTFQIACSATDFSWSGSVYPGTYKVKVAGYSGATNLPNTYFFTHDALQITAPVANLALDVKTLPVSGTVTLNGAAPSRNSCSGPRAEVVFTETAHGYVFTFQIPCSATSFSWSGNVYAGTYSVKVAGYSGATNLPNTYFFTHDALQVSAPISNLALDVKTLAVSGTVTLNGAAPSRNSCSGPRAEVVFTEATHGYVFTFQIPCSATDFSWSGSVYAGTYKVKVAGYSGATNLPNTYFFTHDALQITAPLSNLALDVKTLSVSGTVTLNGSAPTRNSCSGPRAEVVFTESTHGYVFTFQIPCTATDFSWSGSVYAGTYSVKVAGYSGATNLPNTYFFTHDALQVTAPVSNLRLDVKTVPVAGTITLNGAAPARNSCSGPRAEVVFTEKTHGYVFTFQVSCSSTSFSWSGSVYAGIYSVKVAGYSGATNLPNTYDYVASALRVP